MKAIIHTKYGSPDVLRFGDIEKPIPSAHQVLIEVYASSINAADMYVLTGKPMLVRMMIGGMFKPKYPVIGSDVAGRVVAVGAAVTQFQPGDEVFGELGESGRGAYAEYATANEGEIVHKPSGVSFADAASLPIAGITALQGLHNVGKLQAGEHVMVVGASGGVGSLAVGIAKVLGAEVTAVGSTAKLDMLHSLGADHVLDYQREDITRGNARYDLILDAGAYRSFRAYRNVLKPQGRYVLAGGTMGHLFNTMIFGRWASKAGGQSFQVITAQSNQQDLAFLGELVANGQLRPAIDTSYPLDQTIDALRYFAAKRTKGKLVIAVKQADTAYHSTSTTQYAEQLA
jgi:NADPH:quinone reductase-like Zn-dependent oxidoreductase